MWNLAQHTKSCYKICCSSFPQKNRLLKRGRAARNSPSQVEGKFPFNVYQGESHVVLRMTKVNYYEQWN